MKFGLVKSFATDDQELDGLSAQEIFVLGYELAVVDKMLERADPIRQPVHAENKERIESSCKDAERPHKLTWLEGDSSESWLLLEVPPRSEN